MSQVSVPCHAGTATFRDGLGFWKLQEGGGAGASLFAEWVAQVLLLAHAWLLGTALLLAGKQWPHSQDTGPDLHMS